MAVARITHRYADGSETELELSTDHDYPDALDDLTTRILAMYASAIPDVADGEAATPDA
jgi:hypothetical protein